MHPWRHTCWHEQQRIQSSIHYIIILQCTPGEDFTIHGCVSDIPLWKLCCMSFRIFLLVAIFVRLPLWHDFCEWTDELKHFARICLSRKWCIQCRKVNQALQLACFFKMQKPTGCDTATRKHQFMTDSLPPLEHMHASAWKWQFDYFIHMFWHNFFIMGVTCLPGCDKWRPMCNGWSSVYTNGLRGQSAIALFSHSHYTHKFVSYVAQLTILHQILLTITSSFFFFNKSKQATTTKLNALH